MPNPNPECPRDNCKYLQGGGQSTYAYYFPIYDKNGVNINPDRNITTSTLKCLTCNKMWKSTSQLGLTTYEEVLENEDKEKLS